MKKCWMSILMMKIQLKPYIKAFLQTLHRGLYPSVKSESSQKAKKDAKRLHEADVASRNQIELMNKHFNGKSYVKDGIESDF